MGGPATSALSPLSASEIRVALAGNPNCGKSLLFNAWRRALLQRGGLTSIAYVLSFLVYHVGNLLA